MGLRSRPDDCSPALTSTSTTSPGWTTVEPVGVPVRITSPGSSVTSRDRSATRSPKPNSMSWAGRGALAQFAVDPGAQAERGHVDGPRVDQPRADRGEAVDPLRPQVGAFV